MLHYHGTPITPRAQLVRMAGRMFCVSFISPQDLAVCLRIGQSVMFDNGGFSVFTRGAVLDIAGFYAWIEPYLAHPHWAVVPDKIGGTVDEQRAMVATWPHRKDTAVFSALAFVLLAPTPKPLAVVAVIAVWQFVAKVLGGTLWAALLARYGAGPVQMMERKA